MDKVFRPQYAIIMFEILYNMLVASTDPHAKIC